MRRTGDQTRKGTSPLSGVAGSAPETDAARSATADASAVSVSKLSLHDLFEQQARNMLERADISEEQKQSILVAMACPCCGAGVTSFSVKLKAEES